MGGDGPVRPIAAPPGSLSSLASPPLELYAPCDGLCCTHSSPAEAGDFFASGGHGGLPYVLKQRDGSGGAFDGSGGRHGAWLSP